LEKKERKSDGEKKANEFGSEGESLKVIFEGNLA